MSTLNVSNITDGTDTVGTSYVLNGSAKAWADIASAGSLDDSFNVSSLGDDGSGDRSINLSSAMSSANFAANSTIIYAHGSSGHGVRNAPVASITASVINIDTGSTNGSGQFSFQDQPSGMSVHGDLA
jgi:hypothetical protein